MHNVMTSTARTLVRAAAVVYMGALVSCHEHVSFLRRQLRTSSDEVLSASHEKSDFISFGKLDLPIPEPTTAEPATSAPTVALSTSIPTPLPVAEATEDPPQVPTATPAPAPASRAPASPAMPPATPTLTVQPAPGLTAAPGVAATPAPAPIGAPAGMIEATLDPVSYSGDVDELSVAPTLVPTASFPPVTVMPVVSDEAATTLPVASPSPAPTSSRPPSVVDGGAGRAPLASQVPTAAPDGTPSPPDKGNHEPGALEPSDDGSSDRNVAENESSSDLIDEHRQLVTGAIIIGAVAVGVIAVACLAAAYNRYRERYDSDGEDDDELYKARGRQGNPRRPRVLNRGGQFSLSSARSIVVGSSDSFGGASGGNGKASRRARVTSYSSMHAVLNGEDD